MLWCPGDPSEVLCCAADALRGCSFIGHQQFGRRFPLAAYDVRSLQPMLVRPATRWPRALRDPLK